MFLTNLLMGGTAMTGTTMAMPGMEGMPTRRGGQDDNVRNSWD